MIELILFRCPTFQRFHSFLQLRFILLIFPISLFKLLEHKVSDDLRIKCPLVLFNKRLQIFGIVILINLKRSFKILQELQTRVRLLCSIITMSLLEFLKFGKQQFRLFFKLGVYISWILQEQVERIEFDDEGTVFVLLDPIDVIFKHYQRLLQFRF